jgi:hypothetical protein
MDIRMLVEQMVRAMVDHPDRVRCAELEGAQATVLEVSVAPEDLGKVIGKRGVNADAMRRILHAIGGKVRRRYVLEVVQLPTAAPDGEALGADPVSA